MDDEDHLKDDIVIVNDEFKQEHHPPPAQQVDDGFVISPSQRTYYPENIPLAIRTGTDESVTPALTEYGGFARRMAAWLIDLGILYVICLIPTIIIMGILDIVMGTLKANQFIKSIGFNLLIYVIFLIVAIVYLTILESSSRQASFGKRLMKLIVTDEEGVRLTKKKALTRSLVKTLPIICIGVLLIAFSDKKQGLHDRIAKTYVYKR